MGYALTVIIPTFNEEKNIGPMIQAVDTICRSGGIPAEILVVDDDSPDGTQKVVQGLQETMKNVVLHVRTADHGLSQSLYDGMLRASAPVIQCIDSDFSHPPEKISLMYRCINDGGYDMVIGSRYISGGNVINWPWKRRILSAGAAFIGRLLIPHVKDSGSGFFAIRRAILTGVQLTPRGFRMGFEILGKAHWDRVREVPISFKDREQGASKLHRGIVADYLVQCAGILRYNFIERKSRNIVKAWKIFLFAGNPARNPDDPCGKSE
ncbi:MAG: polyprenol monophosphomannose synthase [Methanomicrobiales archaeon]|nr:polyprenol monophosphomannose synthase [Methanomicrobiales archaeon]